MSDGRTIRIFLADDHRILRESLELLLSREEDFEVIGQADNGMNLEDLFLKDTPDVLLMDISMPKRDGLDTARAVKRVFPEIRILFLTMHKNEEMLAEAFRSGCNGYILKENAFEELIDAIRKTMDGGIYVSHELEPFMATGFLSSGKAESKELSRREREILKLLAEGYNNKEIADMLIISVKTVETHRANIMKKNNFKNITELVLYAVRNHIVEP
ncbi:MAG: response regulator [Lachnospiraceae bacterium]